jgi:hypothetical protein
MTEAMKQALALARLVVDDANNSENMRQTQRRRDLKIGSGYSTMLHSGAANDEAIRREMIEAVYGRKGF